MSIISSFSLTTTTSITSVELLSAEAAAEAPVATVFVGTTEAVASDWAARFLLF